MNVRELSRLIERHNYVITCLYTCQDLANMEHSWIKGYWTQKHSAVLEHSLKIYYFLNHSKAFYEFLWWNNALFKHNKHSAFI